MIKSLHISDYALLKNVSIDFTDGFTVVSGETGAGKSIMLDALSLLLGKRVERFSTEENTPKSIIEAIPKSNSRDNDIIGPYNYPSQCFSAFQRQLLS